jgi:hypothetical protein
MGAHRCKCQDPTISFLLEPGVLGPPSLGASSFSLGQHKTQNYYRHILDQESSLAVTFF